MSDSCSSSTSADASGGWERARKCVKILGEVPPLARRSFRALYEGGAITKDRFLMGLLEQPSYRMPLCELLGALGQEASPFTATADLVKQRSPRELLSFLVVAFLEGKMQALIPDAWQEVSARARLQWKVGILIGKTSGRVGLANAMLTGPLRCASYALMSHSTAVPFSKYARVLDERGLWCALDVEESMWGFSHYQVAGQLLALMGLPSEIGKELSSAIAASLTVELPEALAKIRIAAVWTECLARGIELPEVCGEEAFLMEESAMDALLSSIKEVRSSVAE